MRRRCRTAISWSAPPPPAHARQHRSVPGLHLFRPGFCARRAARLPGARGRHDAADAGGGEEPRRRWPDDRRHCRRIRVSRPTAAASPCSSRSAPARSPAPPRRGFARSARSASRMTSSGLRSCRRRRRAARRSRRRHATSTNMTGRPTAAASSPPARSAMATIIGGSPSSTRSTPPPARSARIAAPTDADGFPARLAGRADRRLHRRADERLRLGRRRRLHRAASPAACRATSRPGYRGTFTSLLWGPAGLTGIRPDRRHGWRSCRSIRPRGPGAAAVERAGQHRRRRRRASPVSATATAVAMVVQDYRACARHLRRAGRGAARTITHDNDALAAAGHRAQRQLEEREPTPSRAGCSAPRHASATGKRADGRRSVHGGPVRGQRAALRLGGRQRRPASDAGYYLFYPNPRGSYGQGEAFTARQHARLRRRRPARHPGRHRRRREAPRRSTTSGSA